MSLAVTRYLAQPCNDKAKLCFLNYHVHIVIYSIVRDSVDSKLSGFKELSDLKLSDVILSVPSCSYSTMIIYCNKKRNIFYYYS